MKTPLLIALSALTTLLCACHMPQLDDTQRAKIVGEWVNPQNGNTLHVFEDGQIKLMIGGQEIDGTLHRGGDQVNIAYTMPASMCTGTIGRYHFERYGNELIFKKITDECAERASHLVEPWTAQGEVDSTKLPPLPRNYAALQNHKPIKRHGKPGAQNLPESMSSTTPPAK